MWFSYALVSAVGIVILVHGNKQEEQKSGSNNNYQYNYQPMPYLQNPTYQPQQTFQNQPQNEPQHQNKLTIPEPILSKPAPFQEHQPQYEKKPEATNPFGEYYQPGYISNEFFVDNHGLLGGEITSNHLEHTSELNSGSYILNGGYFENKPKLPPSYQAPVHHIGNTGGYYYYGPPKYDKHSKKDEGIFGAFGKKFSKIISDFFGHDKKDKYKKGHEKQYEDSLFGVLTEDFKKPDDPFNKHSYGFGHG